MSVTLQRFSVSELRLMALGLGAILTVVAFSGLLLPDLKLLHTTRQSVSTLRQATQDASLLEQQITRQHAALEALRFRLHGDMEDLPPRQVESYIIGRLQKVSWNNDVELVSVQPRDGDRVHIFQEMLFSVQLVGHYNAIYGWLWDVRNELGFVVIKELSLSRRNNDDGQPLLTAALTMAAYRKGE
jgi:Tfp pilus assembly protein PilO